MSPSLERIVSSLLCAEDNSSIYCDDEEDAGGAGCGVVEVFEDTWVHRNHRMSHKKRSFFDVGEEELSLSRFPLSDECLALMVRKEKDHLPAADYFKWLITGDLDLGARKVAVDWIFKVHAHFGFGPLCAYLSINYLDRFLSAYEYPKKEDWMMQLLAIACLSLAAKMEEIDVPLSLEFQLNRHVAESRYVFEAMHIQRMELLVLSTLKWRMQAITPFTFIDTFLAKINVGQKTSRSSIIRSTQLILSMIKGIDFLEFRPSEIAAAVAVSVVGENQTVDTKDAISVLIQYVQKEKVLKGVQLINELPLLIAVKGLNESVPSGPQSPIGVLDAACFSYKTDDTTTGSCANSSHSCPITKRRKLN